MGKKKKGKKQEEQVDLSKRRTLKILGGVLVAAIAAPLGIRLLSSATEPDTSYEPPEDPWGFVKRDVNTNDYKDNYMDLTPAQKRYYVQLGTESLTKPKSSQLKEFERVAKDLIKESKSQLGWKKLCIRYTCTDFGQVELMRYAKPYKQYLEKAIDFLYEKLPQLKQERPELRILKPGDDYTHNAKGKAFVGLLYHDLYQVQVINRDTNEGIARTRTHTHKGSAASFDIESNSDKDYRIFFGTAGPASIQAPFSELIPVSTRQNARAHAKCVGLEDALVAAETISEGEAYLLAHEISSKLKIPGGKQVIDKALQGMVSKYARYRFVPQAIAWLKKNGMQKGLDIYLENPDKFMRIIK